MAKLYDQVLSQVKIRDVIQYYNIPIVKNTIKCPFHDDHDPSMRINDKKNIVKCFSCGAGGNPITFIYKYEEQVNKQPITYNEAVKKAAQIGGLDIDFSFLDKEMEKFQYTANGSTYDANQKNLLAMNEYFEKVFENEFSSSDENKPHKYLKNRNIDIDVAKSLGIGYAPNNIVNKIVTRNQKINPVNLMKLGLLRLVNDEYQEVLNERLIIPIKDEKGNIVAFSGRGMDGQEPKYLHVTDSPVFQKAKILYNYDKAKAYAYQDAMYIVEGYMDVIGAKTIGIDNVVALMGTEITDEHIALLKKCNCKLCLALDNDGPGHAAMLKHIPRLIQAGFDVEVTDISLLEKNCATQLKNNEKIKDLGDAATYVKSKLDIEAVTGSGFKYLLDHTYFANQSYDASTIHNVFIQLKQEEIIKNSLQLTTFKELIKEKTEYSFDQIEDIIYPKSLEELEKNPLEKLKLNVLKQHVSLQLSTIMKSSDKSRYDYFKAHKQKINTYCLDKIIKDQAFITLNGEIDFEKLLDDFYKQEKQFSEFAVLNDFVYKDAFEYVYQVNAQGQEHLALSDKQKQIVIDQYNTTLSDQEKIGLGDIKEIYVINKIEDLSIILPNLANPLLKNTIEDKLLTSNAMQYFKFGSVLDKSIINYVDPKYLNSRKDNFKNIILVNNLDKKLQLSLENVVKQDTQTNSKETEKEVEKTPEKVHEHPNIKVYENTNKDRILISKDNIIRSTDKGFEFRTTDPNITIFAPKNLCYWKDENMTHLLIIPKLKAFSKDITTLSKYVDGEYQGRATIDELSKITKFIKTNTPAKKSLSSISLNNANLSEHGQYLHIPAIVNEIHGYFKVNQAYYDQNEKVLKGKPDFEYSFYSMDNKFVSKHRFDTIEKCIQDKMLYDDKQALIDDLALEGF